MCQSGDGLCSGLPLLAGLGQIGGSVFPFRRLPLQVGVGHRAVLPAEEFGPQDADLIGGVEGEPKPVPLTLLFPFSRNLLLKFYLDILIRFWNSTDNHLLITICLIPSSPFDGPRKEFRS